MISWRDEPKEVALPQGEVHVINVPDKSTAVGGLQEYLAETCESEGPRATLAAMVVLRVPKDLARVAHEETSLEDIHAIRKEIDDHLGSVIFNGPSHCAGCEHEQLRVFAIALFETGRRLLDAYWARREVLH
jgi:hypothetical protein